MLLSFIIRKLKFLVLKNEEADPVGVGLQQTGKRQRIFTKIVQYPSPPPSPLCQGPGGGGENKNIT